MGLGLSVAKDMIELHGGQIQGESQEGSGSTFSFLLPREGPAEDAPDTTVSPFLS
jgi:signal transduction histidine kinase